ncbi:MAG: hypothetical protein JXK95_07685 [Bacteroidales bacterium]|nr:hypothetical protein [Bacteroidales bacterium]
MTTPTNNASSGNKEAVVHQVNRVNLYDFGYEKAGSVKGDPEVYVSLLNRIANGDLVEENYRGLTDDEKKERLQLIRDLEKNYQEAEAANAKIETDVAEKNKKIDEFRQELLKMHEIRNNDHEKLRTESFSTLKFSIGLFILIMLSGYLFFFYVSAAYKALYVDFEKIADGIARGAGVGSIMPQPYELAEAIQYNFLLFLVPFVFYAFGWAFHVLLELRQKIKFLFIGLLIAVTFTVDLLLALIIHNNTETAKDLMGLATTPWSSSPTFYIILFLGFLVYITWSLLIDYLMREWDKRKIAVNLRKIIRHLTGDVKLLKAKMMPLDDIKERIANYRDDVNTVMQGNLKKYVDQFSSGWIAYLAPENMKSIKERCLSLKKDFEERNGIRPGIVKIISKRG